MIHSTRWTWLRPKRTVDRNLDDIAGKYEFENFGYSGKSEVIRFNMIDSNRGLNVSSKLEWQDPLGIWTH